MLLSCVAQLPADKPGMDIIAGMMRHTAAYRCADQLQGSNRAIDGPEVGFKGPCVRVTVIMYQGQLLDT